MMLQSPNPQLHPSNKTTPFPTRTHLLMVPIPIHEAFKHLSLWDPFKLSMINVRKHFSYDVFVHTTESAWVFNVHFCMKYIFNHYLHLGEETRAQRYEVTELKSQGWACKMRRADDVQGLHTVSSGCGR